MRNLFFITIICGFTIFQISCHSQKIMNCDAPKFEKIKGLSLVARPDSFKHNPMIDMQAVNAEWTAVIPYGFTRIGEPKVHYNKVKWQWWGERPIGIKTSIRLAKAAGIKTMLKPQIWLTEGWIGELDFEKDNDWKKWEKDYEVFILYMAQIAQEEGAEMLCIGTEFEIHAIKRPQFWRQIIQKIRQQYKGKLTYAANWDKFEKITFWDELDYIGIDAYFPLLNEKTPSVEALKKEWKKPLTKIQNLYCTYKKPILFTEFGYLSVDGTAYNTWELEAKLRSLDVNEVAQSNALEALFDTFWSKNWWAGGFIWKWYPDQISHQKEDKIHYKRGYTPQGKLSEKCIKKWFSK